LSTARFARKRPLSTGGLGIFYWEPEVMTPFDTYASGAWNSATLEPTVIMNGFSA
jgi:arabinogalactan endo-1,4-beta-galactosidase